MFGTFETRREAGGVHRLCTVQGREVLSEAAEEGRGWTLSFLAPFRISTFSQRALGSP